MNISVAALQAPEFINLQPLEISPYLSKCEIKVLYEGQNRNGSYITKEVATEMSKTLRGCPIVGYFKPEKDDFADHGERITFDDEGMHIDCMTTPYGFVAPDAKVWWQLFDDQDEFGNQVQRNYLMTTGFLWTHQFEEAKKAILNEGRPQSMELDEESLQGHWAKDNKSGVEFFIINDATFSKLCILGEDVEPCFEGAKVSAPEVSAAFSKDAGVFKRTLFSMMQELKDIMLSEKGGQQEMDNEMLNAEAVVEEPVVETFTEEVASEEPVDEVAADTFEKREEEEKESESETEDKDEDEEGKKKKEEEYALLQTEYEQLKQEKETLSQNYSALETKYQELLSFKNEIDKKEKQSLIDSFYMLSDEDKNDVVANIDTYSYDEIESKLSVICVRKKVSFNSAISNENENITEENHNSPVTYNLNNNNDGDSYVPAWLSALKNTRDSRNQ